MIPNARRVFTKIFTKTAEMEEESGHLRFVRFVGFEGISSLERKYEVEHMVWLSRTTKDNAPMASSKEEFSDFTLARALWMKLTGQKDDA